jgi:hypothetical protein
VTRSCHHHEGGESVTGEWGGLRSGDSGTTSGYGPAGQQPDESRDAFGERLEQRIAAHHAAMAEQGDRGGHDVSVRSPGDAH